jgi:hypothetical protein
MPSIDGRLPPLSDDLRDWLDGGRQLQSGRTRAHGSPVGEDAFLVDLGTRLEELARLALLDRRQDGASGVALYLDELPAWFIALLAEPSVYEAIKALVGLVGPSAGQERHVRVPFTFATPSPLLVATQAVDEMIVRSDVLVYTAFDGAAPSLALGTAALPALIFAAGEIRPKKIEAWQSLEVFQPAVTPQPVRLTIAPTGSTAGAGLVLLTFRKV